METESLAPILRDHPFFKGMKQEHLEVIAACAAHADFSKGTVIFSQKEDANSCYALYQGQVALDISTQDHGTITIQTLQAGDILGWSWLFPPYVWHFDARATEDTKALVFDGKALRGKLETDPALGFELMKRFSSIVVDRLQATRVQLMDIYGPRGSTSG